MSLTGCVLIDLTGTKITQEERELLRHPVCAGIVLFSRNYQNPRQLRELTAEVRRINPLALIAADQEGGKVQRFREGFTALPSMSKWGALYERDPQSCYQQLTQTIHVLTTELRECGVNLDLIPVLDLNHGISAVIGERSLHRDPNIVIALGDLIVRELHAQHFPAVGKHFPGHGAVAIDSHHDLPIDKRDWSELWHQDLRPFVALIQQLDAIMPAHIIFSALDYRPASFSPFWLKEVLRQQLNFKGVIISDDLTMAAASSQGDYAQRAIESFSAGCDLLLVCNNRTGAVSALDALLPYNRTESAGRIRRMRGVKSST